MSKPLIIYHANCADGFGAAYAAWRRLGPCQFHPGRHGDTPPASNGREVYLLDFSYRREVLKGLCEQAAAVTIIDHHITAQEDLAGLEEEHENLRVVFDMEKSGAVLAWEFFHDTPPPPLLLHIQDRDLWRFELEGTDAVNTALFSYPFELERWQQIEEQPAELSRLRAEGETLLRARRQMIDSYKPRAVTGHIAGFEVPVVNCPRAIVSDLVGELAIGHPFAAGYEDRGERRSWSLRSAPDGENVARIAERFGGGGHPRAAGFSTPLPLALLELEPDE